MKGQTVRDPAATSKTSRHLDLVDRFSAHNYAPLPVVIAKAEGVWIQDVDGRRFLDMLSAYSALEQIERVTLTSRAFQNDQFGPFCQEITALCKQNKVLPMNSGAEAVETALKAVRKWGYKVKGVAPDKAEIICLDNNFHGRTITVVSFSTNPLYRDGFGPFTPGFPLVPFGDAEAVARAITPNTVALLIEPIQGEGGIVVPPDGYLRRVRQICNEHNVLFVADEIQTGLGRTGRMFACDHEDVHPDLLILGKTLGGGVMPVSAVLGSNEVMGVFQPGDHGSTFGGNPLACAVARTSLRILQEEKLPQRAAELGPWLMSELRAIGSPKVKEVRGKGLLIGVEILREAGTAHDYCETLMAEGLLCKETAGQVLRLAPPLVIEKNELEWALERIARVLK
jgi:ornithine--oxo-acid transaminase